MRPLAEGVINQPDRREVLNAIKSHFLELFEEVFHDAEWVGTTDACQHQRSHQYSGVNQKVSQIHDRDLCVV